MGSVVGGIVGTAASYYGAKKSASAAKEAAIREQQAAEAAREEMRFKPVGMTTRFGTATPQFRDGRFSGYTYAATPELSALQDQMSRIYGSSLGQAERAAALQPQYERAAAGLFSLGEQYLGESPEETRQRYMSEQMAALRPYDIEQEQRLAASAFGRGTTGLSVGTGGNPMLQALLESRSRRDLQLAAGADQAAQQRAAYGAGLFGTAAQTQGLGYGLQQTALTPFQQQFAMGQQLESAAQQPLQLGAELGSAASQAGRFAGAAYQSGMQNAAAQQQAAANTMSGFWSQAGQDLGGYLGGLENPFTRKTGTPGVQSGTMFGDYFNRQR